MRKKGEVAVKDRRVITARGIIVPARWDEQGNPVTIMLATYTEEEYILNTTSRKGRQLLDMMQQRVCVTGTLGQPIENRRTLEVDGFDLLEDPHSKISSKPACNPREAART